MISTDAFFEELEKIAMVRINLLKRKKSISSSPKALRDYIVKKLDDKKSHGVVSIGLRDAVDALKK